MPEPLTPILLWLTEEQADISGKELAEIAGIAPQTWSKVRTGKQDLSSDLLWKVLKAIAYLRPASDVARVVSLIEGKKFRAPAVSLTAVIDAADEEELEGAMLQIVKRMFPKSADVSSLEKQIKSPII